MNLSPNFCTKCGNPKNQGEKVCRFCGEPFEDTRNPIFDDDQDEITESQSNPLLEYSTKENTQYDDNQNSIKDNQHNENSLADSVSPNDNTFVEKQQKQNEYHSENSQDYSYFKIPKKWFFVTIITLLTSALIVVAIYLIKTSNSPSETVKQAFEALKNHDADTFCNHMNLSNDTKPYVKEICKKTINYIGDDFKEIEIINETKEENKAVVKMMLVYSNGDKKSLDLHLSKIQDEWKIEPLGDWGLGLDSLFEFGKQFGIGNSGSLEKDIFNIINGLF